jgi:hypothetical protein
VDLSAACAGSQMTGVAKVRHTSQFLATAATAFVLINALPAPAQAFWAQSGGQRHAAVPPAPEYNGSQKARRAAVPRAPRAPQTAKPEPTPTGVFSIIQKSRWHRSNLYDDAPMFFMQRITWSGVALHQGVVPNHPASHGCIRMPEAFARQLWTTTSMGARVIVSRGEVAPVAIAHPNLFAFKRAPVMSQAQSVKAAVETWTFANLASKTPLAGMTVTDLPTITVPEPVMPKAAPARPLKAGPVSVFVSRKEGRLYVRKGFEPVFDVAVAIEQADQPLGTHVFTAMAQNDDNTMRWTVVSMAPAAAGSPASAAGALDRIAIPQDARDQISEMLSPGASLIISDQGLGPETGKGTDFIVLTR